MSPWWCGLPPPHISILLTNIFLDGFGLVGLILQVGLMDPTELGLSFRRRFGLEVLMRESSSYSIFQDMDSVFFTTWRTLGLSGSWLGGGCCPNWKKGLVVPPEEWRSSPGTTPGKHPRWPGTDRTQAGLEGRGVMLKMSFKQIKLRKQWEFRS